MASQKRLQNKKYSSGSKFHSKTMSRVNLNLLAYFRTPTRHHIRPIHPKACLSNRQQGSKGEKAITNHSRGLECQRRLLHACAVRDLHAALAQYCGRRTCNVLHVIVLKRSSHIMHAMASFGQLNSPRAPTRLTRLMHFCCPSKHTLLSEPCNPLSLGCHLWTMLLSIINTQTEQTTTLFHSCTVMSSRSQYPGR